MPIYVKSDKVKSDHTYTQFPIIINDNTDSAVPEWDLFGNGSQSGTPTPDAPIMPTFCGVRTGNLCPPISYANGWVIGYRNGSNGNYIHNNGLYEWLSPFFEMSDFGTSFTISADKSKASDSMSVYYYNGDSYIASQSSTNYNGSVFNNIPNGTTRFCFAIRATAKNESEQIASGWRVFVNAGNTALPYEPYGWAEKITNAGQTVPVYLGQAQTVRRVKKLVLTGTEQMWNQSTTYPGGYFFPWASQNIKGTRGMQFICSHARYVTQISDYIDGTCFSDGSCNIRIMESNSTLQDWKTYLAQQYANGTPVTVWYVLATPTTGIVNEPLAKIGDYADELHSTDAAVTLSLQTGTSNTISIESDLQPSKMNISYYSEGYTDVKKIPMSGDREVKHVLDANGLYVYKSPNYYNWQNIRDIVRAGKGEIYYPVGSIIYDNFDSSTGTAFQVVAHDHHFDPTLTAQGYTHSMTLCEVELADVVSFDEAEAFIYTDTIMPAGTYKFKIPNYESAYGGNKTYYFTSTADLPAGSQIVMRWDYHQPPASVTAYSGATPWNSTTAVTGFNALPLTEWDESVTATDLGTIAGSKTELGHSDFGTMNHIHRARYGSNNYLQSGLRQYINSDGAANAWWQAQTVFDRPYESRSSAGKLTKLNADMIAVMAKPEIQSRTNSYFETTSFDGTTFTLSTNYTITTDKIFLLSPMELNIKTADKTVGSVLDYYVNAGNEERIKYRKSNGSAYYWWLRTPYPSSAHQMRLAAASGALNSYSAYSYVGVASACVIQ